MNKTDTSTQKKKTAYVSLNFYEIQLLKDHATFEGCLTYLLLKKLANFRTGAVKGFNGHKLTYQELAEGLCRRAYQGKAAITINRAQARDIINRMAAVGLVSNVSTENSELTLTLPLSPIEYEQEVETTNGASVIVPKVPQPKKVTQNQPAQLTDSHSGFPDFYDPISVLSSTKNKNNNTHLSTVAREGTPSPAVASSGNSHPQPILEESGAAKATANNSESENQSSVDSRAEEKRPTAEDFESLLKAHKFELTDGGRSRYFYSLWVEARVTLATIEEMVKKCQMDKELKPTTRLLPLMVQEYLTKPQSQRAKVSL